jgi:hypothetical protein
LTAPIAYYPTPPCAAKALLADIKKTRPGITDRPILDPAAGRGALPTWLKSLGAEWYCRELHGGFRKDLIPLSEKVSICNSLAVAWDPLTHVIANPPYGRFLEPFVSKIYGHVREFGTYGAVLMRGQWLDDGQDRHIKFKPDRILRLPWRISYTGKGSPTDTHCWAIWLPNPSRTTVTVWAKRPKVSDDERDLHANMAYNKPLQPKLL